MLKLTKSLPVIKERNCSAYLALNTRTNRKNASEFTGCLRKSMKKGAAILRNSLILNVGHLGLEPRTSRL